MIFMKTMFSLILHASLASAVIILLLLCVRKLFHLRLTPRLFHALWFLVLIKLLVPVGPSSSISLFNLVPETIADNWATNYSHLAYNFGSMKQGEDNDSLLSFPFESGYETNVTLQQGAEESPPPDLSTSRSEVPVSVHSAHLAHTGEVKQGWTVVLAIGLFIWLGGLVILAIYYLIVTLRFRKQVSFSRLINSEEVLSVHQACSEKLGIRQTIPVYETSCLRSPCIYGMTKPKIYLPEDMVIIADSLQLTHILMHELAHYKRKDLWFNSFWTLAVWLHWFNPLVWLARRKMASDREIACDAVVLEVLGEREASSYGMTLLMLSRLFSRSSSPRVNLSYFFNNKNEMKRRVTMIAKFKQGSYRLSAIAILLILVLGAVVLTNGNVESNAPQAAGSKQTNTVSSFQIDRLIPSSKWFNNLDRALDFSTFDFKVPDYLPEGYHLKNVELNENFSKRNKADLIEFVTINFVSDFGQADERNIVVYASKGKGTLLEHNLLWGASYSQEPDHAPSYKQEDLIVGDVNGVMYTDKMPRYKQKPATAKSFVWQDNDVTYSINYFSDDLSQGELAPIVRSYALPDQVQHVDYKGEGNSFPLYDETDLRAAKTILGFPVKFPFDIPDYGLKLFDSLMLQAGDQNTEFPIRPDSDTLWSSYRVPYDSAVYEVNDYVSLYQSKAPVVDTKKLSLLRKLEINGIEIFAYADNDHIYSEPIHSDTNKLKFKTQTYYLWQQDGIYYTAFFLGWTNTRKIT
ncbi:M56 family metallopeptidase [Paenibacillus protaetiae]|uniref:M56 family metallopeptidase n=1 Tax=Paenibacillus protaetiae TaxID=2509456 RepID=A0A4P6ESH5_9BACL|nr:M56 family metallopeptidase [Paenibacillus protaetiae]QAY65844.1 M56 family metallopeptidase [Paenibacillus protaetiae]